MAFFVVGLRLGPIQQFWFTEPDTEPNWLVHLVCHNTIATMLLREGHKFWFGQPDTEDIGYYDYRPVTLLFACFISFQCYA